MCNIVDDLHQNSNFVKVISYVNLNISEYVKNFMFLLYAILYYLKASMMLKRKYSYY